MFNPFHRLLIKFSKNKSFTFVIISLLFCSTILGQVKDQKDIHEEFISSYNNLLKLVQTTKIIKPKILKDASTKYLKSKELFDKNRYPNYYQKQIAAYNRLAQLVVTKKITAPPEIANTQAEYFQAKKRYTESLKNKSVTTGKMPNVSNKKEIYKKYIEAYKKLLDTMHGDMKSERQTPKQKKALKDYQYWKNKYEKAIQSKNIK